MTPENAAIARARALRRDATSPERLLWTYLRTLRPTGHHFRQAPFRGYVLDFVCYRGRLVIEVDGALHRLDSQRAHDTLRDAVLAREGFQTLRFLAADLLSNLEGVSIAISESLATPSPHPFPPHGGEGAADLPPPPCGEGRGGGRSIKG